MLSNSLKNTEQFQTVYREGKSLANRYLVMYLYENHTDGNRVGISVSKKVGNSVRRNRARRLMRESYRLMKDRLPIGYDIIIIARNTITGRTFFEVDKSIKRAFSKAGLLKD